MIFITGVLALIAGLAIVNAHNLWVPDWRVVVTVLGWLSVVGILFRALDSPGDATTTLVTPYIALLCALAIAYGGYASMRQEGLREQDAVTEIETLTLSGDPM